MTSQSSADGSFVLRMYGSLWEVINPRAEEEDKTISAFPVLKRTLSLAFGICPAFFTKQPPGHLGKEKCVMSKRETTKRESALFTTNRSTLN